jgi:sucrose phosphorylase
MFDAVINHISTQSQWFRAFLNDDPKYREYFIIVEGNPDLSQVIRPRVSPLLTPFTTPSGEKMVWTTFSADQVDLNFKNPDVLLEVIDILIFYILQGAELIRLDAIAYLWKEKSSPSIHLPQTHRVIQLFRAILDEVAPHVILVTETNVPHADNISYFGDGTNEAQMVYNFALPPLVLHTIHTGNAEVISQWASGLKTPTSQTTFFNFLASHDGIGLNPVRGILSERAIEDLVAHSMEQGGFVSYKRNTDGSQSPYELNVNYFDALSHPDGNETIETQVNRFILAHAIMLSMPGVPGIYFHSLFGSRGWKEGVAITGYKRAINRQKLSRHELEKELSDPGSRRHLVFSRLAKLLRLRASQPAFHPNGETRVIEFGQSIFAIRRVAPHGREQALCLHNVSGKKIRVVIDSAIAGSGSVVDMFSEREIPGGRKSIQLMPYQFTWLKVKM